MKFDWCVQVLPIRRPIWILRMIASLSQKWMIFLKCLDPSKIHIILVSLVKKEKFVWLTNDDKPFCCIAYRNASSILQHNDWKPTSYKQIYGPCKSTSSSLICTNYWNLPALTRLILYIQVQSFITEILLLHAFGHQEDHVN